jgi:Protein of unknown function (DUF2628)
MENTATNSTIEDEHAWAFFGKNSEYYLQRWQQRRQGSYVTFNTAAFLGGFGWFAYRRMYLVLFCLITLLIVEGMLEEAILGQQRGTGAVLLANLICASLYGTFGNALYLWDAERKMKKLIRLSLPKDELLERLRRAGGTSWWFLPITVLIVAAFGGLYWWATQATAAT